LESDREGDIYRGQASGYLLGLGKERRRKKKEKKKKDKYITR
jgi:hypothetical protein